jgi:hypothetical protein
MRLKCVIADARLNRWTQLRMTLKSPSSRAALGNILALLSSAYFFRYVLIRRSKIARH